MVNNPALAAWHAPGETPAKKAGDWRRLKWRGRHFASPEARPTNAYTEFFVRFGVRDGGLMVEQATHNDGLSYSYRAQASIYICYILPSKVVMSKLCLLLATLFALASI